MKGKKETHSGSQKCQHLIHQLSVGEIPAQHHSTENVSFEILGRCLGLSQELALLNDDVST
jgi:hypothetical protein